jgi:hypothetical protein
VVEIGRETPERIALRDSRFLAGEISRPEVPWDAILAAASTEISPLSIARTNSTVPLRETLLVRSKVSALLNPACFAARSAVLPLSDLAAIAAKSGLPRRSLAAIPFSVAFCQQSARQRYRWAGIREFTEPEWGLHLHQ